MYIAKLSTRYPDFHGSGYYNFLIEDDEDALNSKIEEMSHDFRHIATIKTKHQSIEAIVRAYPSKQKLNERYF